MECSFLKSKNNLLAFSLFTKLLMLFLSRMYKSDPHSVSEQNCHGWYTVLPHPFLESYIFQVIHQKWWIYSYVAIPWESRLKGKSNLRSSHFSRILHKLWIMCKRFLMDVYLYIFLICSKVSLTSLNPQTTKKNREVIEY